MSGRKRFRDDQRLERRDLVEGQKRMKAESKSSGSSEVIRCPREAESHRSAPLEGVEGDDSGSSACSMEESEDADEDGVEGQVFAVQANPGASGCTPVDMDVIWDRCKELRKLMRIRPTLPLKTGGGTLSASDLASGMKLPLYSCPFDKCCYHTNDRDAFLHHISGG